MSLLSLSKKILNREDSKKKPKATKKAAGKKSAAKKTEKKSRPVSLMAGRISLTPVVTEKSIGLHQHNTVVFRVSPRATKQQIAQAVEEQYGAKALRIRTAVFKPKTRRRGMTEGKTNVWKKAYVTVEDIQSFGGNV